MYIMSTWENHTYIGWFFPVLWCFTVAHIPLKKFHRSIAASSHEFGAPSSHGFFTTAKLCLSLMISSGLILALPFGLNGYLHGPFLLPSKKSDHLITFKISDPTVSFISNKLSASHHHYNHTRRHLYSRGSRERKEPYFGRYFFVKAILCRPCFSFRETFWLQ